MSIAPTSRFSTNTMNINHSQAAFLIILLVIAQGSSLKAIDGGYSEWSTFSECNATCGGGIMVRKRSCNNPEPQHGGKNCKGLGTAVEEKNCNSFPCPLDGGYSHWSNFTSCSVTCGGGEQTRIRSCTNPVPCCGGRNCEHLGPSVETRKCNTCKCGIGASYF
ncbi:semaphorin-5A-like isoform X2 [Acropora muricata]|uniref:semaphorin-5A-like isoform X2 n=1 Tax=Acropora muricata TaxID=159855 RepID=UPI0034E52F8C